MVRPPDYTFFIEKDNPEAIELLRKSIVEGRYIHWTGIVTDLRQESNGVSVRIRFTGAPRLAHGL
jgi:hypothetical protein